MLRHTYSFKILLQNPTKKKFANFQYDPTSRFFVIDGLIWKNRSISLGLKSPINFAVRGVMLIPSIWHIRRFWTFLLITVVRVAMIITSIWHIRRFGTFLLITILWRVGRFQLQNAGGQSPPAPPPIPPLIPKKNPILNPINQPISAYNNQPFSAYYHQQ